MPKTEPCSVSSLTVAARSLWRVPLFEQGESLLQMYFESEQALRLLLLVSPAATMRASYALRSRVPLISIHTSPPNSHLDTASRHLPEKFIITL